MSLASKQLFSSQAADGTSPWYKVQGGEAQFGHNVVLITTGTLGGGTLKLEITADPDPIVPANIATLVANVGIGAQSGLILPPGCRIRFNLTGSTAPSLNTWILE